MTEPRAVSCIYSRIQKLLQVRNYLSSSRSLCIESSLANWSSANILGVKPVLNVSAAPVYKASLEPSTLHFSCPECKVLLCTLCKQWSHSNEPYVADSTRLDPVFLRQLGIKAVLNAHRGLKSCSAAHICCSLWS